MTKRETILEDIMSALAGTSLVGTRIYRSRKKGLQKSEHPAIVVEPVRDSAAKETLGRLTWEMIFAVTILNRGDDVSTADPIINDVHNKIMGSSTLNGLAVEVIPISTDFQFIEADETLSVIINQFKFTYQTSLNDLSS